jgi:hypothetical protein
MNNSYIASCSYDREKDPYCPVFKLGTILEEAEANGTERAIMLKRGSVLNIDISWNCNYDIGDVCFPKYTFSRYDLPFNQESAAAGFNFRF